MPMLTQHDRERGSAAMAAINAGSFPFEDATEEDIWCAGFDASSKELRSVIDDHERQSDELAEALRHTIDCPMSDPAECARCASVWSTLRRFEEV